MHFREAAERYVAAHENTWSRKHHATYVGTLRDHVYPVIGVLPVSVIDTTLVLQVLEFVMEGQDRDGLACARAHRGHTRLGSRGRLA